MAGVIISVIMMIIASILVLIAVSLLHELGHYLFFRKNGLKATIKLKGRGLVVESPCYNLLSDEGYASMLAWGILGGAYALLLFALLFDQLLFWLFLPYAVMCLSDIKNYLEVKIRC